MDNAKIHHGEGVAELLERFGELYYTSHLIFTHLSQVSVSNIFRPTLPI